MTTNENYSSILPDSTIDEAGEIKQEITTTPYGKEDWDITQLLSMLPKKKASENFDRKMAAVFALELEKEIQNENAKRTLEKNNQSSC
jgi:hypothetical protein